jgi:hypothetical protein
LAHHERRWIWVGTRCDRWHEHKIYDRVRGKEGDADKLRAGKIITRMTHCDVWRDLFPKLDAAFRDSVRLKMTLADHERRFTVRLP